MQIQRVLKESRLMKALTGLAPEEFQRLLLTFASLLYEEAHRKPRERKLGAGKKGALRQSPEQKRILLLSPTKHGRLHDKKASDKNGGLSCVPATVHAWSDTGFLGHQRDHPNVHMPEKGSKHHPLTEVEKEEN